MSSGVSQPFMRSVSRRPFVEQKVLAILRGDPSAGASDAPAIRNPPPRLSQDDQRLFDDLRVAIAARNLHIRAAGAPFIHDDELKLLAWLAHAQRLTGDLESVDPDAVFLSLLLDCSHVLDRLGLRLPPRSLVNF